MNNRFTIINVLGAIILTAFIVLFFWPICINSFCNAIIWKGNTEADLYSAIVFGIIFLIPLFMGIGGLRKYRLGYGEAKFGSKENYDINAPESRKKLLLYSSVMAILIGLVIVGTMIINIIAIFNRM